MGQFVYFIPHLFPLIVGGVVIFSLGHFSFKFFMHLVNRRFYVAPREGSILGKTAAFLSLGFLPIFFLVGMLESKLDGFLNDLMLNSSIFQRGTFLRKAIFYLEQSSLALIFLVVYLIFYSFLIFLSYSKESNKKWAFLSEVVIFIGIGYLGYLLLVAFGVG